MGLLGGKRNPAATGPGAPLQFLSRRPPTKGGGANCPIKTDHVEGKGIQRETDECEKGKNFQNECRKRVSARRKKNRFASSHQPPQGEVARMALLQKKKRHIFWKVRAGVLVKRVVSPKPRQRDGGLKGGPLTRTNE